MNNKTKKYLKEFEGKTPSLDWCCNCPTSGNRVIRGTQICDGCPAERLSEQALQQAYWQLAEADKQRLSNEKSYILINDDCEFSVVEISEEQFLHLAGTEHMLCMGLISLETKLRIEHESMTKILETSGKSNSVLYYAVD